MGRERVASADDLFPWARVVALRRNPLDTVAANFRQLFATACVQKLFSVHLKAGERTKRGVAEGVDGKHLQRALCGGLFC